MYLHSTWNYGFMLHYIDIADRTKEPNQQFFKTLDECFDVIKKENLSNYNYGFSITPGTFRCFELVENINKEE